MMNAPSKASTANTTVAQATTVFHGVRYLVTDVKRAIDFYTTHLGFKPEHQQLPMFATVALGPLKIHAGAAFRNAVETGPAGRSRSPIRTAIQSSFSSRRIRHEARASDAGRKPPEFSSTPFRKKIMKVIIGTIALILAFMPLAHAEESVGDKVHEAEADAVKAKREAGKEIRHAGREVKAAGREARQAVITRCADGRHTSKGASGCKGHGGVSDPK